MKIIWNPISMPMKEVLLGYGEPLYLLTGYGGLLITTAGLNSGHTPVKPKISPIWLFTEIVCQPLA